MYFIQSVLNWLYLATLAYCVICGSSICFISSDNEHYSLCLFPRATLAALISILQSNLSIPSCHIMFVIVSLVCLPLSLSLYIFNSLYLSYLPVMNFYALSLTFIVFISAFSLSFSLSLVCVWLCLMCIWVFCKHFNKFKSFVAFILIMRI